MVHWLDPEVHRSVAVLLQVFTSCFLSLRHPLSPPSFGDAGGEGVFYNSPPFNQPVGNPVLGSVHRGWFVWGLSLLIREGLYHS